MRVRSTVQQFSKNGCLISPLSKKPMRMLALLLTVALATATEAARAGGRHQELSVAQAASARGPGVALMGRSPEGDGVGRYGVEITMLFSAAVKMGSGALILSTEDTSVPNVEIPATDGAVVVEGCKVSVRFPSLQASTSYTVVLSAGFVDGLPAGANWGFSTAGAKRHPRARARALPCLPLGMAPSPASPS